MTDDTITSMNGKVFTVGAKVLRAERRGSSGAYLQERFVEKIENGKVYLNRQHNYSNLVALNYPEDCWIV